jgi:1-acyl-sn-glycerol-3-phosphate acyltransferase
MELTVSRFLSRLYVIYAVPTMLLWAALVSIPILPFVVLPRGRRERYAIHGAQLFGWLCVRLTMFARDRVEGAHHLPVRPDGPGYLIASNHRSWLDPAMLLLHARAQGIAKKELLWVPFFGPNGYVSGGIFFDRKNPIDRAKVVPEAVMLMRSGGNLQLFPEGTRTRDGRLREKVHLRLLAAAWEAGIDVVPTCCWGTERGAPANTIAALPGQEMGVEFGPPLDRAAFADGDSYARATWEAVRDLCAKHGVA